MSSESSTLQSVLDAAGDAEQLSLAYVSVGDDGCHAVARYVRDNASLQSLDLRGNNTRANGLVVLAHAVKNSSSLVSLCLKWNNVGMDASNEVCTRGLLALTDVLTEPTCILEHLDLRNNNLKPACASHLAEMLGRNMSLRSVDLSWNELGEESGLLLYEALRRNSALVDCQLSGNKLSEDILSNIAAMLRTNRRSLEKPCPSAPSPRSPVSPRPPLSSPSPRSHVHIPPSVPPQSIPSAPPLHAPPTYDIPHAQVTGPAAPPLDDGSQTGDVLNAREAEVRTKLRLREQSAINTDDQALYRSVGDYLDLLVLDVQRAKLYRMDTEQRQRASTNGFADREQRYAHELRALTQVLGKARQEKSDGENELNHIRSNIKRLKDEKHKAMADRCQLEEAAKVSLGRIDRESRDALQVKSEIEEELYSIRRKHEDQKGENERLRVYLSRCKAGLDKALQ